jgi:hypothetical protein
MANLWKRIVKQQMVEEHENDPKYMWETYAKQGWHKREHVAEALECHEDKVQSLLKSAIASKKIERREIVIWSKLNKELVKIVAYRERGRHPEVETPAKAAQPAKKPKRKALRPAVGMSVRSRRGNSGRIIHAGRSVFTVEWANGSVTNPSLASFKKRDIILEG